MEIHCCDKMQLSEHIQLNALPPPTSLAILFSPGFRIIRDSHD